MRATSGLGENQLLVAPDEAPGEPLTRPRSREPRLVAAERSVSPLWPDAAGNNGRGLSSEARSPVGAGLNANQKGKHTFVWEGSPDFGPTYFSKNKSGRPGECTWQQRANRAPRQSCTSSKSRQDRKSLQRH